MSLWAQFLGANFGLLDVLGKTPENPFLQVLVSCFALEKDVNYLQ